MKAGAVTTEMLEGINLATPQTTTYHYTAVGCWQASLG